MYLLNIVLRFLFPMFVRIGYFCRRSTEADVGANDEAPGPRLIGLAGVAGLEGVVGVIGLLEWHPKFLALGVVGGRIAASSDVSRGVASVWGYCRKSSCSKEAFCNLMLSIKVSWLIYSSMSWMSIAPSVCCSFSYKLLGSWEGWMEQAEGHHYQQCGLNCSGFCHIQL